MIGFDEFVERRYKEEVERKYHLSSFNTFINAFVVFVIPIIASVFPLYFLSFKSVFSKVDVTTLFFVAMTLSLASFIVLLYFIYKFYRGEVYQHIPSISNIEKYREELEEWCTLNNENLEVKFQNEFIRVLSKMTDFNYQKNNFKSVILSKIRILIFWTTLFITISICLSKL